MLILWQNKSKYLAVVILILAIFIIPWKIQALLAPQVYLSELDIAKNSFEPGERIEGWVSLWNYEEFIISDLVFYFQLLGEEVDGVPTQMIDEKKDQEIFSISPGEEITRPFTYILPSNLPQGNFTFRSQLANSRGEEMGWIDKMISIGGEGKFLTLDNYWIVREGEDLSPGGGVYYQPGEVSQIRFDITNGTNFTIVSFPKIITYKRNTGGEIVKIQEEKSILSEPGQKKTITTNLPQLDEPESYLSEITLFTEDTLESISNSITFRWIISGEDAEILSVVIDKDSYQAGEEAKVKVQFTGPAHFEVEGGQGELEIKLINEQGKIVGEKKEEIELKTGQILVSVPISEDVVNLKIESKITKGEKVLDEYELKVRPLEKEEITEEEKIEEVGFWEKNKKLIIFILLILLVVLIIMIIVYFKIRKKKSLKTLILLILIGSGLLFVGTFVLAATEVDGGYDDTTIIWNRPLPNQEYKEGEIIKFSGKFRVTSCADGLFHNKIEFFITGDRNIPLETRNVCGDCAGAYSQTYGGCLQNLQWCNAVKIVDQSQSDVYKLGTIYPSDVASGARPYWVEYNQYFTIPENLGFSSPVRFYVQYSGTHWNAHWHWNITYQPGYLNNPPTASISCDPSGCNSIDCIGYTGCPFTLKNNSTDPDGLSDIRKSDWDVLNWGTSPDLSCVVPPHAVCNFTPQSLSSGNYTVKLTVEDTAGQSDSTTRNFTILQEAIADFKCSLDNSTWQDCEDIEPNAKEVVYFLDESLPSEGSSFITNREWSFENGDPGENLGNEINPFTHFQAPGSRRVNLTVTDNQGRTSKETHAISVKSALPKYREVSPSSWLRQFLSNAPNWFRIKI